jgi:hypothetical protein
MAGPVISYEDSLHDGCPILTKGRVIVTSVGVCATIEWQVRNRDGTPFDLSEYICEDADGDSVPDSSSSEPDPPYPLCGQIIFRFADAVMPDIIHQIIGYAVDVDNGIVRVDLTETLVQYSSVYLMDIAVSEQFDTNQYRIVHIDKGMLSVERGLFVPVDTFRAYYGPPTIQELRIALRDSGLENSLLNDVEFDDTEIVYALARPIRQWNETPPPVAFYAARDFPFHEHWLKATMALLMRSAAYWYERNRLASTHGGVTVDDRNKMQTYMVMAQSLYKEWEEFIISKKVSINVAGCYGSVGSPYGW